MTGSCKWCGVTVTARLLSGVVLWFDASNDSRCEDNEPHSAERCGCGSYMDEHFSGSCLLRAGVL